MAKSEIQWGVYYPDGEIEAEDDEHTARFTVDYYNSRSDERHQATLMKRRIMTTRWKEASDGQE